MSKSTDRARPSTTALATGDVLRGHLAAIESAGGSVSRDPADGIATGADADGRTILQALQKGQRGHWILMFYNSKSVKWEPTTTP
jgi:hypothetical protein